MWNVIGVNLQMTEGDYGVSLPVEIKGTTLGAQDSIKLTFKTAVNGDEIMSKDFDGITDNTVSLELTEGESALFSVGVTETSCATSSPTHNFGWWTKHEFGNGE